MHINDKNRIAETIVDYWYTMEFLGQDKVPQLTSEERRRNQEARNRTMQKGPQEHTGANQKKIRKPQALQMLVPLKQGADIFNLIAKETQRHGMTLWGNVSFYVGKIRREYCVRKLVSILNEEDKRPEESEDEIAWFSFQCDSRGRYIENTSSLSTIIWATHHAGKAGKDISAGYLNETIYREAVEEIEYYFKDIEKAKEKAGEQEEISEQDISTLYHEIYKKYINELIGVEKKEDNFFCLMQFQVFKDEEAQEKYTDDNYSGLSMDFYSDDLKMILAKIRSGKFGSNKMQNAIMDYIVGAYSEHYPDKNVLSFEKRINIGASKEGRAKEGELREFLSQILDVKAAPIGKWPSRFMPALMQQIAVNIASGTDNNVAIFSVNGPPGTGKTTLLKEVVANNIIVRAALLAEYESSDDAFLTCNFSHGEKANNGYSKYCSQYYKLKDERINDYSILVASNNNAAVQNITKELPVQNGILGGLKGEEADSLQMKAQLKEVQTLFTVAESDDTQALYNNDDEKEGVYRDIYFSEYVTELLEGERAWGLISAALGKRSNIHKFYDSVLKPLDWDYYKTDIIENRPYKAARKQFLNQKIKVEKLQNKLAEFSTAEKTMRRSCEKLNSNILKLEQEIKQSEQGIQQHAILLKDQAEQTNEINKRYRHQEALVKDLYLKLESQVSAFQTADAEYEARLKKAIETRGRIGFFQKLFSTEEARNKKELADKYAFEANEKKQVVDELRNKKVNHQEAYCEAENRFNTIKQEIQEREREHQEIQRKIKNEEKRILTNKLKKEQCILEREAEAEKYREMIKGADILGDTESFRPLDASYMEKLFAEDVEENTEAQVANLWFTNHYNREREKLFYDALKMNKEFVLSSKCCLRNYRNLGLLWQERKDEDKQKAVFHKEDRETGFSALFQTLFLLVPVISTTFASVGTFLQDIKQPNILGTLIVDEAGQAPPQMALGALYRSRKAIIVGDPRQVEPVVTDDLALLKKAYKEDVYKPYKSKRVSVQQFADIINPYGTYLENEGNEKEWVGSPLVVHRRCISPMYEISNCISYNNTMKQQTRLPAQEKEALFCYPGSRWINVKGAEKGRKNHYVEEQGRRIVEILEIAFAKNDVPSLFVITPFTSVKNGVINCINRYLEDKKDSILREKKDAVKEWMYDNIGTVHTFQGKEADEVIFVLGCDSGKESAGAIKWVSANIVNVAVTRAKYRLYVIGDESAWKASEYVRKAKNIIDTYALQELSRVVNDPEDPYEDRQEKAKLFCGQIPSAESFSVDVSENEEGETEYSFNTDGYLNALRGSDILLKEITDEQLKGYGFDRKRFNSLDVQVKNNIEWGIKLYSMFKSLQKDFKVSEIDASCCGILFCKAIELQVKLCLYDGFRKQFPTELVRKGVKHKERKKDNMTLGSFVFILRKPENVETLVTFMRKINKNEYNQEWWEKYAKKLDHCTQLRNKCCHHSRFTWDDMNDLLINLLLKDKSKEFPVLEGTMFASEVGKELKIAL